MTGLTPVEPVEERLADRLSARRGDAGPSWAVRALRRLGRLDRAAYRAVAGLSTPRLDRPMRRVSNLANYSKPWFVVAGALALFGGARGRRAAVTGVAAIGLTSLVVNQPMKLAGGRGVPENRWVRMPTSTSCPSGHSASAAAFVVAVGDMLPQLHVPLRLAATVVAFSRVYTGVHYPGDVVVGLGVGALLGRATSKGARRLRKNRT